MDAGKGGARMSLAKWALLAAILALGACAFTESGRTAGHVASLELPNYAAPERQLVTAGAITETQLRELAEIGSIRVINLRTLAEPGAAREAEVVAELGIPYVHLPVGGPADLTEANARRLAEVLAARPPGALDVLHCSTSNRVGALLALKAHYVDGEDPDSALAYGRAAGMKSLEPEVTRILGR
jgi:protein tyrosine phosphatase (PTP) superfamily phosphohydrolase (DUF442 family)